MVTENNRDNQEKPTPPPETETTLDEEAAALKHLLEEAQAKAQANLAGWQRAQADFINLKRRTEQEREETVKFANTGLILALLPVLDDFDLALATVPPDQTETPWVAGIRLVCRKLRGILEAQGLQEIKAVGEAFDPNCHEAITRVKGKDGIILQEIKKGYTFRDRVIRPSQVVVGSEELS